MLRHLPRPWAHRDFEEVGRRHLPRRPALADAALQRYDVAQAPGMQRLQELRLCLLLLRK